MTFLVIASLETLFQVIRLWRPGRGSLVGHAFSMPRAAQPKGPENWAHTPINTKHPYTQNTYFHLPTLNKYTQYHPYTNAHTHSSSYRNTKQPHTPK